MKKVCVLFGGVSTEHLISGKSAYNIISGLKKANYNVVCVGITKKGKWIRYEGDVQTILDGTWEDNLSSAITPPAVVKAENGLSVRDFLTTVAGCVPDVVFPAVHGINCEDGTLQGLLELSGIPYVGCGVMASAIGMDKFQAKQLFHLARIPQCRHLAIQRKDIIKNSAQAIRKIEKKIPYPCFLKPNNGGSSVGTQRAKNRVELETALLEVAKYDRTILVEEFVQCREIEAAVLGNEIPKVALLGEIMTGENVEYYDYQAKYFNPNGATVFIPANLSPKMTKDIIRYAKKAYKALGCAGLARVDFFIDKVSERIYINELNTLPGFTAISLFPKAWAASGLPIESLLKKLCDLAIAEKKSKARLEIL